MWWVGSWNPGCVWNWQRSSQISNKLICACTEGNACECIFVNMEEDSARIHQSAEELLPSRIPSCSVLQSSESGSTSHQVRNEANLKRLCRRLVACFCWDRFASAAHLFITTASSSWFEAYRLRYKNGDVSTRPSEKSFDRPGKMSWLVGWFQDWCASPTRNACILLVER